MKIEYKEKILTIFGGAWLMSQKCTTPEQAVLSAREFLEKRGIPKEKIGELLKSLGGEN